MSERARLLDLFCGAGGAARGYQMAGFHVTGIDIAAQPRYAGDAFVQADALAYVAAHGRDFDVIHASPPCQVYSPLNARVGYRHALDLVPPTRAALLAIGRPWVIENVPGAPLVNYTLLCGTMFDLRTIRHRLFECSLGPFLSPRSCCHAVRSCTKKRRVGWDAGLFVSVTGDVGNYCGVGAMGIDWMTGQELSQAIPPAYTHWLGLQMLRAAQRRKEEPHVP